ncbi:XRE family transcriptional regulator [Variovorax sp. 553]|jgi:transcriptional regulator with XRE-family HTH domain|nr:MULTISPECIES: helix-turn-helix transcriptional regulator [unclassified Variovorax]RSZ38215.1 XRE family transcriptional regulator [Variovorax sp. 553]RSZ39334.1 XRE family transcriptional regulator [Variovorax sp. 679]
MPTPSPSYAGDPVLVALGAAIRRARKARGLSQEGLAEDSSVERAYMSSIERGLQNPSVMKLVQVANALGLPLADLIADAGI